MKFRNSMKTLFLWPFLLVLTFVVEINTTGLCITDSDCTAQNTFCNDGGVCVCTAGHTHLNGDCSPVLGRSCLDDLNCDDGRTVCKDSKCVCNSNEWKEESGICASYYGSFCLDWSDCGLSNNYVCEDNTCKCGTGYKLNSDFCKKVINSECRMDNNTDDCPLEHSVCKVPRWNQNSIYGKCKCEGGFDENNGICIQVLGSSCADVGCGSTLHHSYTLLDPSFKTFDNNYFYWTSSDYWFTWNYYYHLHLSCNIDNMCVCDHGFRTDASGIFCEPVYSTPCEGADSCGTYHGYTCDSISKQCVCAENYISYNQEWRYEDDANTNDNLYYYNDHHESSIIQLCKPELGQSCSNVSCDVEHAECDKNNNCSCDEGYTQSFDGTCQQVLGMSCVRETFCQIVQGGFCADDNSCKCKEGYFQTSHICQLVLGSNCTSNIDCNLENTICNEEMCECKSSVDINGERCYGEDCSDVSTLPDIHRRSISNVPVVGEPVIDDSRLKEGWYSIGRHSIHWSEESPDFGHCATFYPVYLTDPLTTSQRDALAAGEDITIVATVGNMDLYGHIEQVDLILRQCGQDTHVYVTPPSTHFSGICLDNENILGITRSTGIKATVLTDLLFSNETLDGVTKHTPYMVFSCVASEFIISHTYEKYPYTGYVTDDDIYFYYVHWYIDSVHFKTIGPLRRYSFINGSSIFEMEIVKAGHQLGFGIRCVFEISENPNGQNSLLAISEEMSTGFQPHKISVDENTDKYFLQLVSSSPLGCETFEGDGVETCDLLWPVIVEDDGVVCNQPASADEHHELCRVFIRGLSYEKHRNSWGSWSYSSQWETNWNYHNDYNYTLTDDVNWSFGNYTTEMLGVYIDIQGTAQTGSMKIKFGQTEATTGHKIWNNYKMPDITLNIARSSTVQEACKISIVSVPILTKETDWTYAFSTENVAIDMVGEFIMYRSSKIPVHIQIQTEECTTSTNGVCICAVNYRNGDNTYIYSYCNGLMRIGQTSGESTNHRIDHVQLINGVVLDIETWNNSILNVSLNTNQSDSTLEDGEGLCMFSPGSYKHRDGTEKTNSDGFVSSWRLSVNESLLNPLNHKGVSWIDEYTQCGCPDDTELLQERELIYNYNDTYRYNDSSYLYINEYYSNTYTVHVGYIRCFAEKICKITHIGDEEWSGSLLPVFSLTRIEARMEIRYAQKWPLLHLLCDFEGQDGYQYGITWKADDDVVYTSPLLDYSTVGSYYVTNEDLQTDKFLLEVKFACGVSIHDASDREILGSQYSDSISAVEFVKTEVLMPRGGDILIQIRFNIPLVCTIGNRCSFDVKFIDSSNANSDCSDSSIAIKSRQTCGQRIVGTSTEDELVNEARIVNVTITTTNNAKYSLKNTFYLKMKLAANGDTSTFWLHTFSQVLTVFVRDEENYWQRNYCYANNDPRMRTFDGQYYNLMMQDVLILMRHKQLPVEIQLETHLCGGWRVACACGVTIRAGRDVFIVNHCHDNHMTGYLLADDGILRVKKRSAHRYQVYLPHGTRVDVRVSSWNGFMVNVFIYPSPADMKNVEGLCGNFNGDWEDDLIHSDGKITTSSQYYWWWYTPDPEDFVQSWGLASTNAQDLTDVDLLGATLHSWYENDVFCVCTGTDGDGEIKCSANEEDTCITKPDKPGLDISISIRNKRSVASPIDENKHRLTKLREKRAVISYKSMRKVKRNAISIDEAIDKCNKTLSSDCAVITAPSDGVNVTFEEMILNCGQDLVDNPDTDWTSLTCEAMEANVENEVQLDTQLQEENPDVASKFTKFCVGNCSGHGQCIEGSCDCNQGYSEDDCSIQLAGLVKIERVTGDGVCDKKQTECSCILLTTSGSLADSLYTAIHSEAQPNGSWKIIETFQGVVDYRNTYEVMFCPNLKRRRKRSTSGNMNIADQYVISLSNDGSTFGNSSTVYVLDSTCLQVNQTNGTDNIILQPGYCIIDGVCYAADTSNPSDSCKLCNDSANPFGWTNNLVKDECGDSEEEAGTETDDTDNDMLILVVAITLSVLAVIAIIVAVIVIKKKTSHRVESTLHAGLGLYDMPKNEKFGLRKQEAWT